jgi:DNA-binding NarL/FixJ family response regulator
MIRALVVDDQEAVRAGLAALLETQDDITVVATAADGEEAVQKSDEHRPDVVLMDIRMPVLDGIAATRCIGAAADGPRVLVLTTFDLDEYVYDALQAGASGFLLKDAPANQLAAGVRMVAAGDALLAPSITRRLIEEFAATPPAAPAPPGLDELTPREREVFRLLAQGKSNAEIAAELIIGETTVKTHVTRTMMKLGVHDRVQAVVLAYELGVVTPSRRSRGS